MAIAFSAAIQRLLHNPAIQILLLIVCGGMAYSNTFEVPFVLDDYHVIVDNGKLANLSTFLGADLFPNPRWVALATFAINRDLGGLDVAGFHAVNLSIHLAAGLVVYFLAKAMITSCGGRIAPRYAFAPLVASLGFVLHPLHTQSVTYIVQRMTSLATLLYLAAVLLYAKAFAGSEASGGLPCPGRYMLYAAAIISCLLAMNTKEISFTLPVTLALFDVCFLRGTIRERIIRLAPFFLCMLVLFFYLIGFDRTREVLSHGGGDQFSHPLSHATYIVTALSVLCTYLRLLVLPIGQNLDYDYPVFTSLSQPQATAAFILIMALLWGGIFLLKGSFNRSCRSPGLQRVCGFAIAWFFITISVESGLVPLIDTIFEHRVYLPSVWFFIAFGMLVCELYQRSTINRQAIVIIMVTLMTLSGYATYRRNHVWRDSLTLWTDVVEKSPMKTRGWTQLGIYFINKSDPAAAIPLLERAVNLNPDYYLAHCWLGLALVQQGAHDRALNHYLAATRLAPAFAKGWESAGRILLEKGQTSEAVFFLKRALELDPAGFVSHEHLQKSLSIDAK